MCNCCHRYGLGSFLFDLIMLCLTMGLWVLRMLFRGPKCHCRRHYC